ncbi:MAG: hypothetical protein RIQ60_1734 [Pseudomonadota bacterium]
MSQTKRQHVQVLIAIAFSAMTAFSQAHAVDQDELYVRAATQYADGHFAAAYEQFAWLADHGHREAARIALDMNRFGMKLYGSIFSAEPHQLLAWRYILPTRTASAR